MRLIDVDQIKIPHKRDDIYYRNTYSSGVTAMVHAIGETPTIEAEPVVHGRWETVPNREYDGFETVIRGKAERCTNCARASKDFKKWFKCCPACGAKMDRGDQDE